MGLSNYLILSDGDDFRSGKSTSASVKSQTRSVTNRVVTHELLKHVWVYVFVPLETPHNISNLSASVTILHPTPPQRHQNNHTQLRTPLLPSPPNDQHRSPHPPQQPSTTSKSLLEHVLRKTQEMHRLQMDARSRSNDGDHLLFQSVLSSAWYADREA